MALIHVSIVCMCVQVICCEGNAGFYEVGCMCTPLDAGYSVLGWNHPGFWGSTVGVNLADFFVDYLLSVSSYIIVYKRQKFVLANTVASINFQGALFATVHHNLRRK
jgi:hypothetical protein